MYSTTGGGHFVSIKSNVNSIQALMDVRRDLCEYAKTLINNVNYSLPFNNHQRQSVLNGNKFVFSIVQAEQSMEKSAMVREIIEGIESEKAVIKLGTQFDGFYDQCMR